MSIQKLRNILLLGGLLTLSQAALAQVVGAGGSPVSPVQTKEIQPSPALRTSEGKTDGVKKAPAPKKQSRSHHTR